MSLSVSSAAFKERERIPQKYTCKGQDISPPLAWESVPEKTSTFALIVDDPDAPGGVFTHWLVFNLPASTYQLPAAIPAQEGLPGGALQGKNDFGRIGYSGPCPPPGPAHHYRFTVYALDKALELKAGARREEVLDMMQGHIIAQGQLTGTYKR
ncbi:MAG: YbhB/YbcL family Raf kinase inhibitor-like protein [Dehalococcoidia bacterium]